MDVEFDPEKRAMTLRERGLDFADASVVFAGEHFTRPDDRKDYGETRFQTIGMLEGRAVFVAWTPRGEARRIISMRYAHEHEAKAFGMD